MFSAPLLVSTDVRNLTSIQKKILLNPEVIGIDQQPIGADCTGRPGRHCGHNTHGQQQVWTKPLQQTTSPSTAGWSDFRAHTAVTMLNMADDVAAPILMNLTEILGLQAHDDVHEEFIRKTLRERFPPLHYLRIRTQHWR